MSIGRVWNTPPFKKDQTYYHPFFTCTTIHVFIAQENRSHIHSKKKIECFTIWLDFSGPIQIFSFQSNYLIVTWKRSAFLPSGFFRFLHNSIYTEPCISPRKRDFRMGVFYFLPFTCNPMTRPRIQNAARVM